MRQIQGPTFKQNYSETEWTRKAFKTIPISKIQ